MTTELYPPTPMGVPPDLATPTARYKRQTAAAVVGVFLFFLFYFGLTGWFALVTYRAVRGFAAHPERTFLVGIPAGFLFLILIKGLFARKKMSRDSLIEVTADEQPDFVAFVHRVADETGASRPSKIYLSADVNAAVFLDVGLINLLIPTRKNLVVGLGLVNSLTLDEFKAVVAHEFGHFAQRSMGVGQWVYLAQSFVSDLIARRDIFDRFIQGLSRIDIRIAWIGWIMRVLVWALRAVVDQFFRFVLLLGRALSRQMEFQADLVSVSVTGSDSLVHALHRLHAADRGWGEAANFVVSDARRGRMTEDLFAIQTRFIERYREVHALSGHGATPERPKGNLDGHRVFAHTIADTPRMWSTHPSNKEREENCKTRYIPSQLDTRDAWQVFRNPEQLKQRVTAHFLDLATRPLPGDPPPPYPAPEPVIVSLDESLARVDEIFGRPALDRRYQGLYTTMQMTRALDRNGPLYIEPSGTPGKDESVSSFHAIFENSVADEVEQFFSLDDELANLEGLRKGFLKAPGGVIIHRGEQLRRKDLAGVVETVRAEFETHRRALAERFQRARGVAIRLARGLDAQRPANEQNSTWEKHLDGLLKLLQYAEHNAANVLDVVTYFEHVLAIVFADGHVSNSEIRRLEGDGERVALTLRQVYNDRTSVHLPDPVRQRLTKDGITWEALIGPELNLHPPTRNDFANQWIEVAASWWSPYISSLNALATHTLDVLIEAEEFLLNKVRDDGDPGDAPLPAVVPVGYPMIYYGDELKRQERLGWWDRFQVAEGFAGGAMRFVVAAAVLAPAFFAGFQTAKNELWVHNGLAIPVVVQLDEETIDVFPGQHFSVEVDGDEVQITTTTGQGQLIESFTGEDLGTMDEPVYNVASAAAFVRWWATYGTQVERPPTFLTGRIIEGEADYFFREPPTQISGRGSGGSRSVIEALDSPLQIMGSLPDNAAEIARVHLQWDPDDSPNYGMWIYGSPESERLGIVRGLYDERPSLRLLLLRSSLEAPEAMEALCVEALAAAGPQGHQALEAAYCAKDQRIFALADGSADPWIRLLAGDQALREHRFDAAMTYYQSIDQLRAFPEAGLQLRMARVLRLQGRMSEANQLPGDGAFYDWLRAIENRSPEATSPTATFAWARADRDFGDAILVQAQNQTECDQLAFGAGSDEAPASWISALSSCTLAFGDRTAAAVAYGIGARTGDSALQTRAASAFAALGGEVDLTAVDLAALRSAPEGLLAGEHSWGLGTQVAVRALGIATFGAEAPAEWRTFVNAAFFEAERPHYN